MYQLSIAKIGRWEDDFFLRRLVKNFLDNSSAFHPFSDGEGARKFLNRRTLKYHYFISQISR